MKRRVLGFDMARVLIATVTEQRSGSKWFGSLLRERLKIAALGEIFNPEATDPLSFRRYVLSKDMRDVFGRDNYNLMDLYFHECSMYFGTAVNFDVMFNQTDWLSLGWNNEKKFIYDYLRSRRAVVVMLLRHPLDIFLSQKTLEISQLPHITELDMDTSGSAATAARKLSGSPPELSETEYQGFLQRLCVNREIARSHFSGYDGYMEIAYEDLVNNLADLDLLDQLILQRGREFGLYRDHINVFPRLIKASQNYRSVFSNYDSFVQSVTRDAAT